MWHANALLHVKALKVGLNEPLDLLHENEAMLGLLILWFENHLTSFDYLFSPINTSKTYLNMYIYGHLLTYYS